jgi:Na+/H+ antiporter NhaD/arsenite permease-like protein
LISTAACNIGDDWVRQMGGQGKFCMVYLTLIIFTISYIGVALGRIPGLMLDRTGIALIGAILMVIGNVVAFDDIPRAIDFPTIILLYALMIVSAQLRLGGFYTQTAIRITSLIDRPRFFLFVSMVISAVMSAVLANDIICLAFTPVLCAGVLRAGVNPIPFLIGLAVSSNIGSSATIIGNPQNMLIGQVGKLDFGHFLAWCGPPSLMALVAAYGVIVRHYNSDLAKKPEKPSPLTEDRWPEPNSWQSAKGLAAAFCLMGLFFTSIPREYSAIAVAGMLLCSRRMRSRQMMELIDWHLITLFCALFVIIRGLESAHIPSLCVQYLDRKGVALSDPGILTVVSTLMSNTVSNVPAVMLLTRFLDHSNPVQWYVLALSSTFAGNLIVIGSIANLIVIEQAKIYGVRISFKEHAKIGIPVTLISLAILLGWIYIG